MSTLTAFNSAQSMPRSVSPKSHLSPREVGEAIGVSKSSMKRWVDEGKIRAPKTAGGHRRISLEEVIRFLRETGMPLKNPSAIGLTDVAAAKQAFDGLDASDRRRAVVDALKEGHAACFRGYLLSRFLEGQSVAELCDGPVTHGLYEIGELWRHNLGGIVVEHRATDICIEALNHLRAMLPPPEPDAPVAIGGAGPDDPYILPSLMASLVLMSLGWRAVNLGANTPLDALALAAEETGAQLVWLSLSVIPDNPENQASTRHAETHHRLERQIRTLVDRLATLPARLVLGGRGAPAVFRADALKPVTLARGMADLAEIGAARTQDGAPVDPDAGDQVAS